MKQGVTAAEQNIAQKQWSDIVRTQIHFNEIIHRTRQMTATVVLAAFGAAMASFVTRPTAHFVIWEWHLPDMQLSTPLVIIGWIFLLIGMLLDRGYYYKLLIAAVVAAEKLEHDYDLPAKLSVSLSKAVSRKQASLVIYTFYIIGFVIGLALIIFFNSVKILS